MAKPDWGDLQQRFLSAHAKTGISPKDWCEAQGLNYASARRYIKKPSEKSRQKTAQTEVRTAQKEKCAESLADDDVLTSQQRLFIAEYLKDSNATQAAIRAGYSERTAYSIGQRLLKKVEIAQAIAQQQKASIVRTLGSADEVLEKAWQLATFDANEISQYRRGACRYCWGFSYHYQWRDAVEFEEKRSEAVERKRKEPLDTGGYGYNHTRDPNPECPRCNGEGVGRAVMQDSTKLSSVGRLAYAGTKITRGGVEISTINRERMFEAVMKRLGLAESEFAQRLQQIETERRQLEVEKLRRELSSDPEDSEPVPVAVNINVVDARVRTDDDGDLTDT
ncbi:terminase small subunit [Pantoea sp. JV6]|uniref:terminase small subunit n=1 Tax=Pantoea sp. JV6 TaxID=2981604 RepID=UPI00222116AC|nr:terminase small subunit [Pantoea sp. JV6]MCW0974152.1 terminase small subunit [Pantoea sp. JV6]